MDFSHVFDVITSIASLAIVWLGLKLMTIADTLKGISGQLTKMSTDDEREHHDIKTNIADLSRTMITEVRSINDAHSEHDKKNVEIHKDIESCLYELRRQPPLIREDK